MTTPAQLQVSIPLSDGATDSAYVILPGDGVTQGRPLVMLLHSWTGDSSQRQFEIETEGAKLGWVMLRPNFRGPNLNPQACASDRARQDLIEAVAWMHTKYGIDLSHVFLFGASGGAHMALIMAGRHPTYWRAVSAWIPPTNLWTWRSENDHNGDGQNDDYWNILRACCAPLYDDEAEHLRRSPVTWLAGARDVAVDIAAGVNDPTVPYHHSVDAFNVIAAANGGDSPNPGGAQSYEREIITRRYAGASRLTIFNGVHEALVQPTIDWILSHMSATQVAFVPTTVVYRPTGDASEVLVVGREQGELRNVLLRDAATLRAQYESQKPRIGTSARAALDLQGFVAAVQQKKP